MMGRSSSTSSSGSKLKSTRMLWMMGGLLVVWLDLNLLGLVRVSVSTSVRPRQCGGTIRHIHLSVGGRDASTSMTVSFASFSSKFETPPVGAVWVLRQQQQQQQQQQQPTDASPVIAELDTIRVDDGIVYVEAESASSYKLNVPKSQATVDETYFSPYYHHVTITGLQPNATYYYVPLLKPTFQSYEDSYAKVTRATLPEDTEKPRTIDERHHSMTVEEMVEAFQSLNNLEDTDTDYDAEGESFRYFRTRRRRLINWPPYDGSGRDCPSPEQLRTFRTAPALSSRSTTSATTTATTAASPLRIAVVGDLGQFPHSEETLTRLLQTQDTTDLILLAGDIAYTSQDHRRWDTFFDFMDDYPISHQVPMQICPGNHDIDKTNEGDEIFLAYEHRFRMPRVKPPLLGKYEGPTGALNMDAPPYPLPYEWGNAYYSFHYGTAFVIMLSPYSSMEPGSLQYQWLRRELESVDRTVTPWLLVVLHTPLYNTFSLHHRDLQIVAAKKHLEPLLVEHRVNLVLTGHIHAYSRTTPVAFDQVVPTGPVHITVGAGGRKCEAPFTNAEPENWVQVRDATHYGYGQLEIRNETHALWQWIQTTSQSDEGRDYNVLEPTKKKHKKQGEENDPETTKLPAGPDDDTVFIQNQFFL